MPILGQRGRGLGQKIGIKLSCFTSKAPTEWNSTTTLQTLLRRLSSVQFDMMISPKFGIPTDRVLNEQILRHAGKIFYTSFQVSGLINILRCDSC